MLRTLFSMVIDHGPSYRALQLSWNMCVLSFSIACVDQFPEYRKAYFDTKYTLRNSNYLMYSMITFQGTKKLVNSLLVAYKNIFKKLFKRSCCLLHLCGLHVLWIPTANQFCISSLRRKIHQLILCAHNRNNYYLSISAFGSNLSTFTLASLKTKRYCLLFFQTTNAWNCRATSSLSQMLM